MAQEPNILIISGSYGSGKTEYAINLATRCRVEGRDCLLVDLDVVNPYFRTRDVRDLFARRGISVIAPEGSLSHADLPMLSPRVSGALTIEDKTVILDAGGDAMGARVLGRYCREIEKRPYSMVLVINTRRPGTRDAEGVMAQMDAIQHKAGLAFTEIVSNTHLMEDTDEDVVREGAAVARQVAESRGLIFRRVCVLEDYLSRVAPGAVDAEIFVLKKYMKKPWEILSSTRRAGDGRS